MSIAATDIETAEMAAFLRATDDELFRELKPEQQDKLRDEWFDTLDREDLFNIATMAAEHQHCNRADQSWEAFLRRKDLRMTEPYRSTLLDAYEVNH